MTNSEIMWKMTPVVLAVWLLTSPTFAICSRLPFPRQVEFQLPCLAPTTAKLLLPTAVALFASAFENVQPLRQVSDSPLRKILFVVLHGSNDLGFVQQFS